MTAFSKTLCAVLLSCGFAGSAVAATATAPTGSTNSQSATSTQQMRGHISQKLRNDLAKAGFTNITIMPSSFLVRAKDPEGDPMMMVINPNSITEVTAQAAPAASSAMKAQPSSQSSASTPNQNSATTPKK